MDFFYNYSHSFVLLSLVLGKKEEQILGSNFFFCASTFVIKMINADLAVMLVEIGRETLNINQTCFFIIVYLTSFFSTMQIYPTSFF